MRAEMTIREQHRDRSGDHRHREDDQDRVGQDRPDEQRQTAPRHALRAHVGDRRVEVDRAHDRGQPRQVDQVDPRVLAAAGRVDRAGQRRVAGPAGFRRVPEERGIEDDAARQEQPEGECVQARVGHVAGADHQRHEVVRQPGHHRHDEQEDHRRPVHREQLVIGLGRHQRVVRRAQLQAHHQRLDSAQTEEHERQDHVHDPDPLVIGGGDPARPAFLLALDVVGYYLGDWGCVGGHHRSFGDIRESRDPFSGVARHDLRGVRRDIYGFSTLPGPTWEFSFARSSAASTLASLISCF